MDAATGDGLVADWLSGRCGHRVGLRTDAGWDRDDEGGSGRLNLSNNLFSDLYV